jgi:hypothetical protein
MDRQKQLDDAAFVQRFLDDERIQKAFADMEAAIHRGWASAQDYEEREEQWRLLKLLERFRSQLERHLRNAAVLGVKNG